MVLDLEVVLLNWFFTFALKKYNNKPFLQNEYCLKSSSFYNTAKTPKNNNFFSNGDLFMCLYELLDKQIIALTALLILHLSLKLAYYFV